MSDYKQHCEAYLQQNQKTAMTSKSAPKNNNKPAWNQPIVGKSNPPVPPNRISRLYKKKSAAEKGTWDEFLGNVSSIVFCCILELIKKSLFIYRILK